MEFEVQIIRGPKSAKISAQEAEAQLRTHPRFPKNASVSMEDIDGTWVAALATPKVAAPPFPTDDEPAGPPAGPDGPPEPSGPEGEGESEPKPEGEKPKGDDKKPKGESAELAQVLDILHSITDALGLTSPDGMGAEGEMGPTPPPGAGGPPVGPPGPPTPDGVGSDGKTHTVHERSLKPGEAPPGVPPIGTPAFSNTRYPEDHPWFGELSRGAKFWDVEDEIGSDPLSKVAQELAGLATPVGCKIENLTPEIRGDRRIAKARIVRVR